MGSRAVVVQTGGFGSLRLDRIKVTSQDVLSGDCNFPFEPDDADPDNYSVDTLFELPSTIHNESVNVLFADYHVSRYKKMNLGEITYAYDQARCAVPVSTFAGCHHGKDDLRFFPILNMLGSR